LRAFSLHHVPVKIRRTTHCLASVVDDEIQPLARGKQVSAKRFDTRRMTQIESKNLQPMAPVIEVRLLRVTRRRVPGEARCGNQLRPRAQKLDPRLIANFHAAAG
jgi:hypothetical protein